MQSTVFSKMVSQPVFLFLAFGIMIFLRFIYLESDPSFLMNRAFITDEGWWVHNARNAVLFGKWVIDEFNQALYIAPLFSIIEYSVFKILGVSIFSARLAPAITGSLSIIVFYMLLRRFWNKEKSVLASLFLGLSAIHIYYSRMAFIETTIILFLLLSLFFWVKGNDHWIWSVSSGVYIGMALITKITAVFFFPIFIILWSMEFVRKEFILKKSILFAIGASIVVLPYLIFFVLFSWEEWSNNFGGRYNSITLFNVWKIFTNTTFSLTPILSSILYLYLFWFFPRAIKRWKDTIMEIDYLEVLSLSIFIGNAALLVFFPSQPERRYLVSIIPLAIISTKVLYHLKDYLKIEWVSTKGGTVSLFLILFHLWFYIVYILLFICNVLSIDILNFPPVYLGNVCRIVLDFFENSITHNPKIFLSILFIPSFILIFGVFNKTIRINYTSPLLRNIIAHGAVLFFVVQSLQVVSMISCPTYSLKEASKKIGNIVGGGSVALLYSTLMIDTDASLLVPHYNYRNSPVFQRLSPDFALTTSIDNGQNFDENYVVYMAQKEEVPPESTLVERFYLCPFAGIDHRFVVCLWQITK
ncbi:MAG: glycosyltransferase family 39 protein [Thermodesulfobacteriota bacterium]|nr:glycosyltransferase family 39 protein [Thermodesulfobacteriota bacterium]